MSSQPVLGASQAVDTPYPDSPWVVLKFGGRSVSTAENWAIVARLIRERLAEGVRPVVVHSALVGVSNALITLLDTAAAGGDTDEQLAKIRAQHDALARDLGVDPAMRRALDALAGHCRRADPRGRGIHARRQPGEPRHRAGAAICARRGWTSLGRHPRYSRYRWA
jgi:aspartokinase